MRAWVGHVCGAGQESRRRGSSSSGFGSDMGGGPGTRLRKSSTLEPGSPRTAEQRWNHSHFLICARSDTRGSPIPAMDCGR